ncbi:hypothetical protein IFR09_16195 [Pseudomonas syringae]|nr:hypothetical protein [Pseudomonas syringae]MBD8575280.1 hypothetical protein [Pseudomonas syringae]MBD8788173.1 hypothetical protein [Pseudomonas syringae]MBD8799628.1 hypothetical protein [Pseudomonas syringae]MBD8812708.1 hypothetical protein [Pseudomonas syringae]
MRPTVSILAFGLLAGCAGPLPVHDPGLAWVDLYTPTGKMVMADKLDGERTWDGRYFQVAPGKHELQVRFDYEYRSGTALGMFSDDLTEITCFIEVDYDHFQAGQRYRLEVRSLTNDIEARLYDTQRQVVAREGHIQCI